MTMIYDTMNTIGSDEAGVGDYFGPMTVCASYVPKDKIALLRELGVKDSKNLSNSTVDRLAREIIHIVPYSLVILDNPSYNKKIDEGWNIVKLKAVLHDHCIQKAHEKMEQPDDLEAIVIDQFTPENAYRKYVPDPFRPALIYQFTIEKAYLNYIPDPIRPELIQQETKAASKSIAVASASNLSRSRYLEQMANLNRSLKRDVPRWASKKTDLFAAELAWRHGM